MNMKLLLAFVLALTISSGAALAYVTSADYARSSYMGAAHGYAGYGVYDGDYGLVARTPYPYAGYRLAESRLTYGEYSRFTGRFHHPYTGRTMPETWRGYGTSDAIPTVGYPYMMRTLHR